MLRLDRIYVRGFKVRQASVPRGRPVFPGVGQTTTAEQVMIKAGLIHKGTRMLDASVNCRVEEWGKG